MRRTTRNLGWTLNRGSLKPCEACSVREAKRKALEQKKEEPTTTKEKRMYTDIQTFKARQGEKPLVKPHMCMRVLEGSQLKFASFHQTKNGMIEPLCEQLSRWKQQGLGIDIIRCDNAGENKGLQARANSAAWKLNIAFEYTARDTPQQNHLAEIAISNINCKGRATMHRAHVPEQYRQIFFRDAWLTAVKLDGLEVVEIDNVKKTRYEHVFKRNPAFAGHLRIWGEAGTVKLKTSTSPKMDNKGKPCMFIGYTNDHAGDCYRMWNPTTNRVHETRDVFWLRRMFFRAPSLPVQIATTPQAGERDEDEEDHTEDADEDADTQSTISNEEEDPTSSKSSGLFSTQNELANLDSKSKLQCIKLMTALNFWNVSILA